MIFKLIADINSSRKYAYDNGWLTSITDFWDYAPESLSEFRTDLGMENSPNPRLWEKLDVMLKDAILMFDGRTIPPTAPNTAPINSKATTPI